MNYQQTCADQPYQVAETSTKVAWAARIRTHVQVLCLLVCTCAYGPASATPIFSDAFPPPNPANLTGWTNSAGNFVVDWPNYTSASFATASRTVSYSTASSLFSYQASDASFFADGYHSFIGDYAIDTQISVIVEGTGTVTGNLLGGTLTVRAGAQGEPGLGAAANETLMVGHAIDSAALLPDGLFGPALLFALTYTIDSLSGFGDYITFVGTYGQNWSTGGGNSPWGRDWTATNGFTFDDFVATHKVPEPATYALLLVGLAVFGLMARRREVI